MKVTKPLRRSSFGARSVRYKGANGASSGYHIPCYPSNIKGLGGVGDNGR
jgi:hypothetical protein